MTEPSLPEESIFAQALEIASTAERAAYLDRACGHNQALRAEVKALLRAHEKSGDLLDLPENLPVTTDLPAREGSGTVIGPYKLLEQIGEGGMGAVFLAEQTKPVQRKVALKLTKSGMDSQQVIARFEAERQAIALMDHPNIAKVLDAGTTETGRPYFVMELVKGVPIIRYCDERHLTPRRRLELFVPVCQAVQHAHQKGIIHRDLKPSNVLVCLYDGQPVPKVIDFGIAKAAGPRLTEKTLFTEIGQVVGTLEYMSPEQAELNQLDIDTRSDIYSLGVLLYELLTGTTPLERKRFQAAPFLEVLRLIREEESPRPSTRLSTTEGLPAIAANRGLEPKKLSGLMRGELDWIVMKTLEKDRNRRYETANGLAMDVQRYLADEPVQACPPSTVYRLKKFLRRNKGPVLAAGLLLLALIGGIIGTTFGLWRAGNEATKAAQERDRAKEARDRAVDTLDAMTSSVIGDALAQQMAITPEQQQFLTTALEYYRELLQEEASDARARKRLAAAAFRIAVITNRLGRNEEASVAYRQARDLYTELAAEFRTVAEYREILALSHGNRGNVLAGLDRPKEAEDEHVAAIAAFQKLADEFPTVPKYRNDVARSHNNLGAHLIKLRRSEQAVREIRASLAVQQKLVAEFADPEYRRLLATIRSNLGALLQDHLGKPDQAATEYRAVLALRKGLAAEFPALEYRQDLAISHYNLGCQLRALGQLAQAQAELRAAVDLSKQLVQGFPSEPQRREDLADWEERLAHLLAELGKREEAETEYRAVLVLRKQLVQDFPDAARSRHALATSHFRLGLWLQGLGQGDRAEVAFRAAIDQWKKLAREFPTLALYRHNLASSHNYLGVVLADLGKGLEADAAYRSALGLSQQLVADDQAEPQYPIDLAGIYCNLGHLLAKGERLGEALACYDQAVAALSRAVPKETQVVTVRLFLFNSRFGRAHLLDRLKRHDEAATDWIGAMNLSPPGQQSFFRRALMLSRARAGQTETALADADQLANSSPADVKYDCARAYALAHAKTKDVKHAARAVELIHQAVARGYRDVAQMKKETDLDSLRARDDFQKLLAELEK